jgi:hypothetical protein
MVKVVVLAAGVLVILLLPLFLLLFAVRQGGDNGERAVEDQER